MIARLLITGSRKTIPEMHQRCREVIFNAQDAAKGNLTIIVGDALGIDQEAVLTCCLHKIPFECYGIHPKPRNIKEIPDFGSYTQCLGNYLDRDEYMVRQATHVYAFCLNGSKGTMYTYNFGIKHLGKEKCFLKEYRTNVE